MTCYQITIRSIATLATIVNSYSAIKMETLAMRPRNSGTKLATRIAGSWSGDGLATRIPTITKRREAEKGITGALMLITTPPPHRTSSAPAGRHQRHSELLSTA